MERKKVFELIDGERKYQDTIRKDRECDNRNQFDISIAEWLIYIEAQLIKAKQGVYRLDEDLSLNSIRKIASLCVACMEYWETLSRDEEEAK